jgi:hypothetical protein
LQNFQRQNPSVGLSFDIGALDRFLLVGVVILDQIKKLRNKKVYKGLMEEMELINRVVKNG